MFNSLDAVLDNALSNGQIIGAVSAVFRNGEKIYSGKAGFAHKAKNIPISDDSVFRLFSLTKPVTAVASMIAMDMGLICPDDPVSKFFPEFSQLSYVNENNEIVPCDVQIKLSHLLNMTSGIPYPDNWGVSVCAMGRLFDEIIEGQDSGNELTTEEICRKTASVPLLYKPGQQWSYGFSADIMGGIIEKASGMKYSDFLKKYIFGPLGMNDTDFYVPADKLHRFTALYGWGSNGLEENHDRHLGLTDYLKPPAFESGGAGLVSTINDYSKFACMLANKGVFNGIRIISENAFAYLTAPKLDDTQSSYLWERLVGYNYGCFMRIMESPEISLNRTFKGEMGWDGWTGTFFAVDPVNNIAVLYFTQICGGGTTPQAEEMCRIVYKNI